MAALRWVAAQRGRTDERDTLTNGTVAPPAPSLPLAAPLCLFSHLRLLQVLDSSFPIGAFAHSGGLEAALSLRVVSDRPSLVRFLRLQLSHAASSQLPTLCLAHRLSAAPATESPACVDPSEPPTLAALDGWYGSSVASDVQRAASESLGRNFLAAFLASAASQSSQSPLPPASSLPHCHFPVAFAAALQSLGAPLPLLSCVHLHLTARALLSAAVRLDLCGPREAQSLLAQLSAGDCLDLSHRWAEAELSDSHGVLEVDLLAQAHGRLFTRLFVT